MEVCGWSRPKEDASTLARRMEDSQLEDKAAAAAERERLEAPRGHGAGGSLCGRAREHPPR
eukprot:1781651-Pyramimonas_sp.AAC.1